ncbi:putative porin [Rheinheimera baltica]|uniref:putative porin n=1 Tax=Rheinheimera baltica TaxID=67576 RepID=UPI00273D5BF0|nr:putative porin [Rheinheimera baltica]MDP5143663.1 putative porin [Rheinheimera baltica]
MTLKYVLPVIALAASAAVSAEDYQTFVTVGADHYRVSGESESNWGVKGQHYFNKITTLGPLDQFGYILAETNVTADYSRRFDSNFWSVGGEYFVENGLMLSAKHQSAGDFDATTVGIGYLVSKDLLVKVEAIKPEDGDTDFLLSARYNHQLQGNDYIGFTAFADDEFDYYGVTSKYFSSLGDERYLTAEVTVERSDDETLWALASNYYFSKMTSVGVTYNKADSYSLTAKHFLTQNWAVEARFASNTDISELKTYSVGVTGQF